MQLNEPVGGQLEILSKNDISRIHAATMRVYEKVGIKIWLPEAFRLFRDAGAKVDEKNAIIHPSESFLKDTLKNAPSEFFLYGRDPSYKLHMGGNHVHFSLCGQGVKVQDLDGKVRLGTLRDVEQMAKLSDWCENIHHTSMMTTPCEVNQSAFHLYLLWANLKNSRKTTDGYAWTRRWSEEDIALAMIIRGGKEELMKKPLMLGFFNPLSPLQLSKELSEGAIYWARMNQPVLYAPEALSGVTAPATLAGLMVQQNAEVLSGIMLAQLANPGAPVLYGTVSAALDMRTGIPALGGPEVGLINLATAQIARHYKLPSRGTGGNTDSKLVDAQAGVESALSIYAAGLAGINFIYDSAGSLDGSIATSYAKIVFDNEVCGMVSRMLKGIEVTDDTLAVEEICKAGSNPSYMGTKFTMKKFRQEHFIPQLMNRQARDAWEAAGGKNIVDEATKKARQVLKEHEVEPLEKHVLNEGEAYMKKQIKAYA
jgi:trimethylamine--corrinoid protein Co-methyltransferase